MGLLRLLDGTAQLHCLRRFLQAWLYAHRLALQARTALHIAPRRPRRFDIFRYRYLLFTFKFWWRYCLRLRLAMHGIDLATLGEPEREASPCSQSSATPQSTTLAPMVFDGRIWFKLAQSMSYASLCALRCLSKAHAWRVRMALTRTATHVIGGRLALVWEFYSEIFIQLAPPLQRVVFAMPGAASPRVFASELPCTLVAGSAMGFAQLRPGQPRIGHSWVFSIDFITTDVSKAPREQRVTALRSLGAEKMVQLEGELREARLTLFGPLPASKSGKAPLTSPLLQALCHRQSSALPKSPLRPRRSQSPHRQKTPPPPAAPHHGMARRTANAKPRVALPIQPRTAKKLEDQMIQHRIAKSLGTGPTNKARERDASGQTFRMPTSNLDLGWAAFYKASPRQGFFGLALRRGLALPRPALFVLAELSNIDVVPCNAHAWACSATFLAVLNCRLAFMHPRRWAAQASQRQAESSAAAAPSLPAPPCIDLSTQNADPAWLPPSLPDTLDYGDASPATNHCADIAPTQLDSPCISVSSTEDVELVPPAPPTHSAVLLSLAASSKHPAHHTGAVCPSVPKALTHGPLPTVADLAIPPPVLRTSPARLAMYPSSCPAPSHLPNPAPQKRTRTSPPLHVGGLPVPPPPAAPLSLTQPQRQQAPAQPPHVATQPRTLPVAHLGPRLKPPCPRKVRVTRTRPSLELRAQHCGTHWSQLLFRLGSASLLFRSVSGTKDAAQHMLAVIRKFAPSTLERYLRIANQFLSFLEACDIAFSQVTLAAVLDYLDAARASRSQDLEIHRISATSAIKALRWFHKLSQWEQLTPAMQSPVIAAYCSQSTAKDRREAMPIPMALISAWEQRVCDPDAPLCTVLCLGAALLATHASLRFGDIQRVDFSSLSLTTAALHGVCFATKTTSQGQPFAVTISGITGRDASSCWPLHWLSALHQAASPFRAQDGDPDFLWFSTTPELKNLLELAPASYCTALLVLRWATLPWHPANPGLSALEASQLTLHSMKSTVLAAAAQLRLSKDIRLSQGHRRDSAALYSRNDTFDSLFAQRRLSLALSRGWRPQRSIARGGQAPIPEPPFALPPTEPLAELPAGAILQGPWSFFATRHESLQAALPVSNTHAPTRAPLSPPTSPRSPSFEPASHSDHCSDEEARMVELAALRRQSSTSSHASTSSLSSDVPEPDPSLTDKPLYACTGPWGCWRCLKPPDDSGVLRTACGLNLGLASFTSEEPPPPLCRHMACVIRRAGHLR
ncbi:unnamed protein product [Symbiodinium microadriaticum]|nr:unnamed protein product [Symbiodinium microadriaticum]